MITHQQPNNNNPLQEPLFITGEHNYTNEHLALENGMVYFYPKDLTSLVFEVENNFESKRARDIGGISVIADKSGYHLYEYSNPNTHIDFKHIRVTKRVNNYYGEGSPDRENWFQTGMRFIPGVTTIGVSYYAKFQEYIINNIKVYHDSQWQIFGIFQGFRVRVTNLHTDISEEVIATETGNLRFSNISYPYNCQVEIWNNDNLQILNKTLENVWGGDQYVVSVNVHLYNRDRELLHLEDSRFIGTARTIEKLSYPIYAVNHGDVTANIKISVSLESPAYEWVTLGYDHQTMFDLHKELTFSIPPNDEVRFWIYINNPHSYQIIPPGYFEGKEYIFMLELDDIGGVLG